MVDQSIIDTANRYIQSIPESMDIKKAYLFGSYAKENQHIDSDIDIAIVLGKMDDFFSVQMQLMRLRRLIDLRIEPHPIWEGDFNIQNPFAYEIEKTGIILKP
ncbi:MAG: nucleotidyltransferase domain-containing protein [Bacteroidales bacterium]|nr:nucleotidyltransferase domain-containing protein [Bacteroidales bacterium]